MSLKKHWNRIYATKDPGEVSWTQEIPKTSLEFIHSFDLPKDAPIIDIGGGDSKLVDYLILEGYSDITVLDISQKAIEKAKHRLGKKAGQIKWFISDIINFKTDRIFELWHDRATFHFLVSDAAVEKYLDIAHSTIRENGYMAMGTFSTDGPDQCSGLPVKRYSEDSLTFQLHNRFSRIKCIREDHITPFRSRQNFLFCSFRKK